jgi:hypothetical protein
MDINTLKIEIIKQIIEINDIEVLKDIQKMIIELTSESNITE